MKKLLLLTLMLSIPVMAQASVVMDQVNDATYMKNYGYSTPMAEAVAISKARMAGEEYYTEGELTVRNASGWTKFWRKFYSYMDPAAEDYSMYHHDSSVVPKYSDL